MTDTRIIFILASIHQVLKAEKVLKKADMPFDLIPVPKEVNPDCGMAIEMTPELSDAGQAAMEKAGLTIESIYTRQDKQFSRIK